MGLTLTFEDFRRCLRNPWTVSSCSFLNLTSFIILSGVIALVSGRCGIFGSIHHQADVRLFHCNGMSCHVSYTFLLSSVVVVVTAKF